MVWRIQFGTGPGGWDSWDSWDGWDGWDSWDQQINTQLEAQSGYIICLCFVSVVSLPYQNSVHIMDHSNLNWYDAKIQTEIQRIDHVYCQDYFGIIRYYASTQFSNLLFLFPKPIVWELLSSYIICI